ncbi:unnamed protein product [Adineta ricciae]|uniref:Uncharacterized protein n=1 Tax=Adineta ricciae TaxID=249248 RepID=A0A814HTQ8_ADIRI|nr:unnamed protein product [Adineta ricciae]
MEDDSHAIAVGLGVGLGGFVGFIVIGCVLWKFCCGYCFEKKNVKSTAVQIPLRGQRIHRTEPPYAIQNHTTRFGPD